MPRIRTISQTQNIFTGPTPSTGGHWVSGAGTKFTFQQAGTTGLVKELYRIQDYTAAFNIDPQPVSQFGDLAPLDYVSLNPPNATLSFSYLVANMQNEKTLGFNLSSGTLVGAISGILTKASDDKNYFIPTAAEGFDLHGGVGTTIQSAIAIGNGFITNYQFQASVGQFPTVSIDVQGSNFEVDSSFSGDNPAINPFNGTKLANNYYEIPTGNNSTTNVSGLATNASLLSVSALRPGDLIFQIDYTNLGASTSDWKVQSLNLQIPFNRQDIAALGNRFAIARELTPPINATLSVNALVGDMVSGSLNDVFGNCGSAGYNAVIKLIGPCPTNNVGLAGYIIKGATMTSQEYTSSIGGAETITMNFLIPVGGATSTGVNIFFSGLAA